MFSTFFPIVVLFVFATAVVLIMIYSAGAIGYKDKESSKIEPIRMRYITRNRCSNEISGEILYDRDSIYRL